MRQALACLALAAVFMTGCSTLAPNSTDLNGPMTTIAVTTGADDLTTLGVPFEGTTPVVENVSVTITSLDDPEDPVALTFSFADGLYSYDPEGLITTIDFAFLGTVNVALPAGHNYGFEATGTDSTPVWLAYGRSYAYVVSTTTTVELALQTMIDAATLDTTSPTSAVVPGQTIDLHLAVNAPGGYTVPVADYTVTYAILPADGTIDATSKLGTRAVATTSPETDTFTLTATITGWRNIAGVATKSDIVTTFEAPYAITSSLGFDTTPPEATINATTEPAYAGTAYALNGTAMDDGGLDRVHLYEGPVLIASSEPLEYEADTVTPITLFSVGGSWNADWTPTTTGTHTLTLLAIDTSGNEQRATTTIEVSEPITTLTFVNGEYGTPATLSAGENVILQGTANTSFDASALGIYLHSVGPVSTAGVVVADGMWTLDWTAPAAGSYILEYGVDLENGSLGLTIE